jgi:hypothetical protein
MRKRVGRNRNVEVFDASAPLLEPCLDVAKVRADVVVPERARQLAREECPSLLQRPSALTSWQARKPVQRAAARGSARGLVRTRLRGRPYAALLCFLAFRLFVAVDGALRRYFFSRISAGIPRRLLSSRMCSMLSPRSLLSTS